MERLTRKIEKSSWRDRGRKPSGYTSDYTKQEVVGRLAAYEGIGTAEEFAALKQAQSEGRLVELPCKAGDTIYQLRNKKHAKGKGISPRIATCVTVFGSKMYRVEHQGATPCEVYDLGKTWFLTREAAEAALAEKEEE